MKYYFIPTPHFQYWKNPRRGFFFYDTCCGVRFSQLCRAVLKLLEYSWLPSEGGGGFASDLINTLVNSFAVQTKKNMTFTLKGVQLPWKLRSFSDDRFWIKTLNGKTILRNFSGNVEDLSWWFSGKWSQYLGKRRGKRFLFDFVISWNKGTTIITWMVFWEVESISWHKGEMKGGGLNVLSAVAGRILTETSPSPDSTSMILQYKQISVLLRSPWKWGNILFCWILIKEIILKKW